MDSQKAGRDEGKGPDRDSPHDEKTLKEWHEFAEKLDITVTLAQVAYELWVDKQINHDQPNWNDLSSEEQARWPMAYSQPGYTLGMVIERVRAVSLEVVTDEIIARMRESWSPSSNVGPSRENIPKCPQCQIAKTSKPCYGPPPCDECVKRKRNAEECASWDRLGWKNRGSGGGGGAGLDTEKSSKRLGDGKGGGIAA